MDVFLSIFVEYSLFDDFVNTCISYPNIHHVTYSWIIHKGDNSYRHLLCCNCVMMILNKMTTKTSLFLFVNLVQHNYLSNFIKYVTIQKIKENTFWIERKGIFIGPVQTWFVFKLVKLASCKHHVMIVKYA
ncbi:hypothetical protein KUTeg_009620 [Tegillarca granosa]|uniref:Uncharacterized protein n=1 Tax=Tegillarca granosa TaxID=220873 RepID=A0ABQ9F4F6_TEGGR|nr:hypothetical protein KUTeg_009620 [Tegillarca granosa]